MLFSDIAIIDESFAVREHVWVGTQGERIAYVGECAPSPEEAAKFGEAVDGAGRLLMPAMYNAHTHAPMTLLRGYAENVPLMEWLNEHIWPFEAKMTAEDNYWGMLLACAEAARYGTVSFSDMYFHAHHRVRALVEAGMKANVCHTIIAGPELSYTGASDYAYSEALFDELDGAGEGRIKVEYNIHAEYTSNPAFCREIAEHAKRRGKGIHLHLSETTGEHEQCKERHDGLTPLRYFESLGVLDVPVTAAHCVWVDDEDIELMVRHGVTASLCPASNMKLGSGFAPAGKLLAAGVNVALGTDGMASNNNHDMFQDLYVLATVYKGATLDPLCVSPAEALRAATRGGALAQGREDCGLIKEGIRADLVMLDADGVSWHPTHNALCNLVFAGHGSDVLLTMCDGRVIYREGTWPTIDVERAKDEVDARAKRIVSEL